MVGEIWDALDEAAKPLAAVVRKHVQKEVDLAKQELRDDADALEAKVAELSREIAGLKAKGKGWLR